MTVELTRKQMRLLGHCDRCAAGGRDPGSPFSACGRHAGRFCPRPPQAAKDWFALIGRVDD